MKTTLLKFPLTTFIKNVQSTIRKVGEFAFNIVEYLLVGIGIAAKMHEVIIAGFNMPLSFYTDMALDMLLIWGWVNCLNANHKILRRRLTTCALNFYYFLPKKSGGLVNLQGLNISGYNLRKQYQLRLSVLNLSIQNVRHRLNI